MLRLSFKACQLSLTRTRDYFKKIKFGFQNAGQTYNTGNLTALVGAVPQMFFNAGGDLVQTATALYGYFLGNSWAMATTAAAIAFFHGGVRYDEAFAPCAEDKPPDLDKNNQGHFWSAIGAGLLGIGMVGLGQTPLAKGSAAAGGILHTFGKTGSLLLPRYDAFFKCLPLASRAPAFISLVEDLRENIVKYPRLTEAALHSILPFALIGCNLLWGRADVMLMPEGRVRRALGKVLFVPPAPAI
jgi:hypothetical protein